MDISESTIIAGPCSAESLRQLKDTASALKGMGIDKIRAGVWKPRTRPNSFEGIGIKALEWVSEVSHELDVEFIVEVANAQHVEEVLKKGIKSIWIGARTTVNPFTVQEIADSLKGNDHVEVLVKNPVNPDLALWIGAIERFQHANIQNIGAIHRGFSSFRKSIYRNEPVWQIPIEFKRKYPDMKLYCDPSHIGGKRDMIFDISQKALDMGYDGLMIETHINPENALSDPDQQLSPDELKNVISKLRVRKNSFDDVVFKSKLEELRDKIDSIDHDLLETLSSRTKIIEQIGEYKKENNVKILQLERWNEIIKTRPQWAETLGLSKEFIEDIYKRIHEESIRVQTETLQTKKSTTH